MKRFGAAIVFPFLRLPEGVRHKQKTETMSKSLILMALFISFITMTFGQKKNVNKVFKFEENDSLLALVPVLNNDFTYTDTVLVDFYSKNYFSRFKIIKPGIIRSKIEIDNKLKEVILKIVMQEYSKKELKEFPNLNTILDISEIDYLKEKIDDANFLLIPVDIRFGTNFGSTFGFSRFRLYKLPTGELIFDCPMDFNVNSTDAREKRNLMIILLGETSVFFRDKVINN